MASITSDWTPFCSTTGGEILIRRSGLEEITLLVPRQSELTPDAIYERFLGLYWGQPTRGIERPDDHPENGPDQYVLTIRLYLDGTEF